MSVAAVNGPTGSKVAARAKPTDGLAKKASQADHAPRPRIMLGIPSYRKPLLVDIRALA